MVSGAGCHGVSGELCGLISPVGEHHRRIAAEVIACLSTPFVGEPVPVGGPVVGAEFPHPGENRAVVERVVGEIIGHVAHDHAGGPGAHAGNHEEVVEKLLVGDGLQVNVGVQAPCGCGLQGGFEEEQAQAVELGVGRIQHALGGGHEVVGAAIVGDFFAHVLPEFFNGVLCLSRLHRVAEDRHRQGIPQGGGGYSDQPVVFLVGDSFAEVYAQVALRAFDQFRVEHRAVDVEGFVPAGYVGDMNVIIAAFGIPHAPVGGKHSSGVVAISVPGVIIRKQGSPRFERPADTNRTIGYAHGNSFDLSRQAISSV